MNFDDTELVEEYSSADEYGDVDRHFWLLYLGEAVAFVHVIDHLVDSVVELCEIEVKEEHRGLGVSSYLLELVSLRLEKQMIHQGPYTASGYQRLAHHFGHSGLADYPSIPAKSFVKDWSSRTPMFYPTLKV